MPVEPILIAGRWQASAATGTFRSENPATREPLAEEYPVSSWHDVDAALAAAVGAHQRLRNVSGEAIARFLDSYADRIEAAKSDLAELANRETALPATPRLAEVELPRTTNQLRQAAEAARDGSWRMATLDTKLNIRSRYASIGPVAVFGPNNFPLAFNSVSGGDFAAAIAAGNPVIAKANSSHPGTTRRLGQLAHQAAESTGMPPGTVQLLYRTSHADGERLVADSRLGATGYTGSRAAGLALKTAADAAGKPIYLELSSINPVVILPGALAERGDKIVEEFAGSCLMGTGQFCTNPGLIVLFKGAPAEQFLAAAAERFAAAPVGTLLSRGVDRSLGESVAALRGFGAEVVVGGTPGGGSGYSFANTLLKTTAAVFMADAAAWQREMFGNASLVIIADSVDEAVALVDRTEGNLTGCIYSANDGRDDMLYDQVAAHLRPRVGRLLNDKMPTGVAVSLAMNHGGPYPATGHPGFTAVGIPASLRRFAVLECYDNVRRHRLPVELEDRNPNGRMWRLIDGQWSQGDA